MRYRYALFCADVAAAEMMHRLDSPTPFWPAAAAPWLALAMTFVPLHKAYVEFPADERQEAIRTGLWAVVGLVTLLAGPPRLRFG